MLSVPQTVTRSIIYLLFVRTLTGYCKRCLTHLSAVMLMVMYLSWTYP